MKILIKDSSILTMDSKRLFIDRGYVYIDRDRIVAVGEGEPQPEFEFADYIINDRFTVLLPGFTVGLGDIISYLFRFIENPMDTRGIIDTLSKGDLNALIEVALTSLVANGATSIITLLHNTDPKILSAIVSAASSNWIRTRIVLLDSSIDLDSIENDIRNALKSSRDPEAVSRNIISFGLYIKNESVIKKIASIINSTISIYVDSAIQQTLYDTFPDFENKHVIVVNPTTAYTKCIFSEIELWKYNCGISPYNPILLNPKRLLQRLYHIINDEEKSIAILSSLNPANHGMGSGVIKENTLADVIILDFSEPPYGPIPMTRRAIASEMINASFLVKTVIIGGEIVLDNGVLLTIGRESIVRVQNLLKEFESTI
ncbi:MAG: hypothetical protein QXO42_04210 [Ignisphaera sp.]